MNEKHHRRLVKAMYDVQDFPALDNYGSSIFGRPIRGSWKLFRHIVKMATADNWRWKKGQEVASYPQKARVANFDEFATFMCHEAAHGWCYFHKENDAQWEYFTGVNEERACWEVSRLVCGLLRISYREKLADMSYQCYLFAHAHDIKGLEQLVAKMPKHLQL